VKLFRRFYNAYRERFFAFLARYTGDSDLAGELLQESFTRYLEHYGPERCDAPLLYAIGRNAALDAMRRNRRLAPLEVEGPDPRDDQETLLLAKEAYTRMQAGFARLGMEEREILSLAASGDLTYRQIGGLLGISEANVKVRVHRARVKLRALMER
jgi:RNA polymerase sigma-70 factor (ECF subfamily)